MSLTAVPQEPFSRYSQPTFFSPPSLLSTIFPSTLMAQGGNTYFNPSGPGTPCAETSSSLPDFSSAPSRVTLTVFVQGRVTRFSK